MNLLKSSISAFLIFGVAGCAKRPINIRPFSRFNEIDTLNDRGKTLLVKTDCFLIEKYHDNKRYQKYIDSFIFKHKAADFSSYSQYDVVVYKQSARTNFNPDIIDHKNDHTLPPQEDMVLNYIWSNGKFFNKIRLKDGQPIIDADNKIKVQDIK